MNELLMPVVFAALASAVSPEPAPPELSVRRFALIAAANDGGADRPRLRYAVTDARTVARVLHGLGGVAKEDHRLLVQPTAEGFAAALADMGRRLEAARGTARRIELVVYYSGHSDAEGLLLGGQRYAYRALKGALAELPADVRIAILDSCASGAMTRLKGGFRRPPFTVDASNRVKGYAVLTSSSEDEAAQESDRLGASFFTHFLVSGLRGAGDLSQDGRVTLNEAYNFAFHETLARTENTRAGAQHAAYDIQLVGSGDVVMTDLRSTTAALGLAESSYGRVYIRDADGRLAVELRKNAGRPVRLGLEPGTYSVTVERDGQRFQGEVTVAAGRRVDLDFARLTITEAEETTVRGGRTPVAYKVVPINVGILPAFSLNGDDQRTLNHFSLSLIMSRADALQGASFSLGANLLDRELTGFQAAIGFNYVGESATGGQWSVGFNRARQLTGVQSTVGVNLIEGPGVGAQLSVGANLATAHLEGGQFAVGLNYARSVDGFQMSSGVNVSGPLSGGQMGLVNVLTAPASGLQIGLVNYGEAVAGLQLGLINVVDRTEGLSLGLLNYAVEDGIFDVRAYSSDIALGGAAVAVGTRYVYTALSAGTGTWEDSDAVSFGLHLGFRVQMTDAFAIDLEFGTSAIYDDRDFEDSDLLNSARLTVAYRFFDGFAVYVGPTFNVLVDLEDSIAAERHPLAPDYASRPGNDRVYLWPGLIAGLQLF